MQKDTQVQKLHFLVERLLDFSTCMAPEMMVSERLSFGPP